MGVRSTLAAMQPMESIAARFEQFYSGSWRDAVRWATALTGDRSAGEDVAQDAFGRVADRFGALDNPLGYLRIAVVNGARDHRRSQQRRADRELRVVRAEPPGAPAPYDTRLLRDLAKLPYEQRAVLVLRYWADWTENEIAEALDCRPSTVRSHAKRGLDALRRSIATEDRS